jgi:hypothetical protein
VQSAVLLAKEGAISSATGLFAHRLAIVPVAGVHANFLFDSETDPEAGLAPRVIGMMTTAMLAAKNVSAPASKYLDRRACESAFALANLLSISESPSSVSVIESFATASPVLLAFVLAPNWKARQIAPPGSLVFRYFKLISFEVTVLVKGLAVKRITAVSFASGLVAV